MSTQKNIDQRQSASGGAVVDANPDANATTDTVTAEKPPPAEDDHAKRTTALDSDKSEAVAAKSECNTQEGNPSSPSKDGRNVTAVAMSVVESTEISNNKDTTESNGSENSTSAEIPDNQQNTNQESPSKAQHPNNIDDGSMTVEPNTKSSDGSSGKLGENADDNNMNSDAEAMDKSSQGEKIDDHINAEALSNELPEQSSTVADAVTNSQQIVDSDGKSKPSSDTNNSNENVDKKADDIMNAEAMPKSSKGEMADDDMNTEAMLKSSNELPENSSTKAPISKKASAIADAVANAQQWLDSGANSKPLSDTNNNNNANSDKQQQQQQQQPITRSRTRSLSSALSSLSGGESVGGGDHHVTNNPILDNNGKTPRIKNRMSSQGPVQKKKGPRALFKTNNNESSSSDLLPPSQEVLVPANVKNGTEPRDDDGSSMPPPMENNTNEGLMMSPSSNSITFAIPARRPRSNTIDSFRAAMDSSSVNHDDTIDIDMLLPTESIILPERKEDDDQETEDILLPERKEDDQEAEDIILFPERKQEDDQEEDILFPERKEDDDQEEDILLPERKGDRRHEEKIKEEEGLVVGEGDDNAKQVQDILASSDGNDHEKPPPSPRIRSDTMDIIASSKAAHLKNPRRRSDTLDFLTGSTSAADDDFANKLDKHLQHNNPLASPSDFLKNNPNPLASPRDRSDTIDFLKNNPNPLASPRGRADTIDFLTGCESFSKDDEKAEGVIMGSSHDDSHHGNPPLTPRVRSDTTDFGNSLSSPRGRPRSDTIDFLTSEFQVDGDHEAARGEDGEIHPTPFKEMSGICSKATPVIVAKKVEINAPSAQKSRLKSNFIRRMNDYEPNQLTDSAKKGVAFGKTPKKTNRSRAASHASEPMSRGLLRKKYRTRSLSFAPCEKESKRESSKPVAQNPPVKTEEEESSAKEDVLVSGVNENDIAATESETSGRDRGNTLDSFHLHDAVYGRSSAGRPRSDTLDFLTAAVAGDMGHDLDAAIAAAADDDATFAMHTVSAPSGASARFNERPHRAGARRPRSDTFDSTTSSIQDFLVSVVAGQGMLGGGRERTGSFAASENSSENHHQRRPRSNTLEIYSNMNPANRTRSGTIGTVGTVDFLIGSHDDDQDDVVGNIDDVITLPDNGSESTEVYGNVMDHLKALCDEPKIKRNNHENSSKASRMLRRKRRSSSVDMTDGLASPRAKTAEGSSAPVNKKPRKNSEATMKTTFSMEHVMMNTLSSSRSRLESWGGMSDLSAAGGVGNTLATHTALKDMGIFDDVLAAAADLGDDDEGELSEDLSKGGASNHSLERIQNIGKITSDAKSPSGLDIEATTKQKPRRPRKDSIGALSLASLSDTSISIAGPKNLPDPSKPPAKTAPPIKPSDNDTISAPSIVVDYDAIAAAVNAANAAIDGMDLAAILGEPTSKSSVAKLKSKPNLPLKAGVSRPKTSMPQSLAKRPILPLRGTLTQYQRVPPKPPAVTSMLQSLPRPNGAGPDKIVSGTNMMIPKAVPGKSPVPFPVASINIPFVPIPKSTKTKEEMDAIRERARAAAGYVPPGAGGKTPARRPPPPRRPHVPKYTTPNPHLRHPAYRPAPGMPPRGMMPPGPPRPPMAPPHQTHPSYRPPGALTRAPSSTYGTKTSHGTLQSQQKWDDMFDCLVKFIEETREKCTKHMNEQQKGAWIWDGNVPTSYKTPCGKALGRWINNQRSAKAKGTLKDDREVRLVSTGLKWSVLTTNSWRQMLNELEIYVHEQTKEGRIWDGNVPTNYKIKSSLPPGAITTPGGEDEEKNLGRWVNRQRSLFQAGKLKKERQRDLERIGLKWSVLLTTSWGTMYDALVKYADDKRKQSPSGAWDGNVPANFKTRGNPPLSLGRWVNRQRSAHAKGRLKEEYVNKLEVVGLKWVIHTRGMVYNGVAGVGGGANGEEEDYDYDAGEFIQPGNTNSIQPSNVLSAPAGANSAAAAPLNENAAAALTQV